MIEAAIKKPSPAIVPQLPPSPTPALASNPQRTKKRASAFLLHFHPSGHPLECERKELPRIALARSFARSGGSVDKKLRMALSSVIEEHEKKL